MTFRFYITDLCDGVIRGTNESLVAREFATSEDHFVVDTAEGTHWHGQNGKSKIEEVEAPNE